MIVDVEDAGSGSLPRALVMVRDGLLCFLNLLSFLKMVFISLSELWCLKHCDKVAGRKKFSITSAHECFNSDQSLIHPFLCLSNNSDDYHHLNYIIFTSFFTTEHVYLFTML